MLTASIYSLMENGKMQTEMMQDEQALRGIVQQLAAAWTAADGQAFAAPFAEDADYTIVNGEKVRGRQVIAEGHQQIFDTIYRGTALQLEAEQVRFLRDDVATVHAIGGLLGGGQSERPRSRLLLVCTKEEGQWQVTVFQNTPIVANRPV
jgi:uncharacterized protein (TIGR02246 family)